MKRSLFWLSPLLVSSAALAFSAQQLPEIKAKPSYDAAAATAGASTYSTYCVSCHGKEARGDGPLADSLRFAPSDLTRLARRNNGKLDLDRLQRVIDGRQRVKGHGGTDMPVWGDALLQSREGYDADKVKQKINELVHFVASIQE
jgi:mono/diheme cytochrome c family protein